MKKTIVVLPCHNQEDIITTNLEILSRQDTKPDMVIVVEDHSDSFNLKSSTDGWLKVVHAQDQGRSSTRNLGIREALKEGAEIVVFMDGDSVPEDDLYLSRIVTHFVRNDKVLLFGTRVHQERPFNLRKWFEGSETFYHKFDNRPSDLLTANMDNLDKGLPLDHRDLRESSGIVEAYNNCETFNERVDFMISGMISWSCNFAVSAEALKSISEFMETSYGLEGMYFDEDYFKSQWGYEDVAFGLDALFAGVDVRLQSDSRVLHFMHGRSDALITHVQGKHLIMDRYRHLLRVQAPDIFMDSILKDEVIVTKTSVSFNGRSVYRFGELDGDVLISREGDVKIGGYFYNYRDGSFKKDTSTRILVKILKKLLPFL